MTHIELRQKFIDFWKSKNHAEIPSASLIPADNDSSVLFTTAGMQPLVPYLLGQTHPMGKRLVDCQICLRTDDIDEVGDSIHHTFFEMLGNWSLGDYFKKDAVTWSYEFLTKVLNINPEKLYVTCFAGDSDAPKDIETAEVWQSLGIPPERIFFNSKKDNWWGPVGNTGPCGPDTEMFYEFHKTPCGPNCQPGCNCGRFSEIWNNVFMEYFKTDKNTYEPLKQKNVDTGMGLDRTLAVINGFDDDYKTELWQPAIKKIEELSGKKYEENSKAFRIITDHIRAAIFIINDGVTPSNKERGYILRRLIRRSITQSKLNNINSDLIEILNIFIEIMSPVYPDLKAKQSAIQNIFNEEVKKFTKTLDTGLNLIGKINPFDLFQSYGFPPEITAELLKEKGLNFNWEDFNEKMKQHQDLSRTASAGMFKGGLADNSEIVTKYHTATHLLQAALRKVLGDHVHQEGSNINSERLRFDFSHQDKLTPEQITSVENLVNKYITDSLERKTETMTYDEAINSGALAFFKERYPEKVTVYSFGDISREICGGPHVDNTKDIGKFKIIKQESVASGIKRIYAQI